MKYKTLIIAAALLTATITTNAQSLILKSSNGTDIPQKNIERHLDSILQHNKDIKVGLVLAGGGAKGVAHVGVLKVLEEAGIKVDIVTGTSIGAIVGGLYAIGYTPQMMDSLFRTQDWIYLLGSSIQRRNILYKRKEIEDKTILNIPIKRGRLQFSTGLLSGQSVLNMILDCTAGYHGDIDFDSLPIPFACVAYDIVAGKDTVLRKGNFPLAIRSSMSIPGAFNAVKNGNMVLIDGGVSNNFPVDVAMQMGADVIIGIDISNQAPSKTSYDNPTSIFSRLIDLLGEDRFNSHIEQTDLYIHPPVDPYSAASFSADAIDTLLRRGEETARAQWDEIVAFKKKIDAARARCGIPDKQRPRYTIADSVYINRIIFEGTEEHLEKYYTNLIPISPHSHISMQDIKHSIEVMRGTDGFSTVEYQLTPSSLKNVQNLTFICTPKAKSAIDVGLHIDSDELAAIYLNSRLVPEWSQNLELDLEGKLATNPYGKIGLYWANDFVGRIGISYKYRYGDFDMNTNNAEKLDYGVGFHNHSIDLDLANFYRKYINFYIGARYEYFRTKDILFDTNLEPFSNPTGKLISYRAQVDVDNLDNAWLPHKGILFHAGIEAVTDDGIKYNGDKAFFTGAIKIAGAIPVTSKFTFIPNLNTRMIFGDDIAYNYVNALGGHYSGRYLDQQIEFAGTHRIILLENKFISAGAEFRYNIFKSHYIWIKGSYGLGTDDSSHFMDMSCTKYTGASIGYSLDTPFGPLELMINNSNIKGNKFGIFFNLGKHF